MSVLLTATSPARKGSTGHIVGIDKSCAEWMFECTNN